MPKKAASPRQFRERIHLWWLGVVALGLARVSNLAFSKLALLLFGLWAMLRL
jgi:hypothetical protein